MKLIVIPVKFALKLDVSCLRSLEGIQILKEELAMCIFSKIQRFFSARNILPAFKYSQWQLIISRDRISHIKIAQKLRTEACSGAKWSFSEVTSFEGYEPD